MLVTLDLGFTGSFQQQMVMDNKSGYDVGIVMNIKK